MGKRRKSQQNNQAMSLEEGLAMVSGVAGRGEIKIEASSPEPNQSENQPENQPEPARPAAPPETETREPMTRAGPAQYSDFFGLYAKMVRERGRRLVGFRPLGYVPGPAVVLEFREEGESRIVSATPDVAKTLGTTPTDWMTWDRLPERIRQALSEHRAMVDGLGYEPSPWNLGLARGLLGGIAPAKYLAMIMTKFRYRSGDPELPFGVVLLPVLEGGILKGLKVKTYNPHGIPDCPAEDAVLELSELKDGKGPVQKMFKTWAQMENNFSNRYDRTGNRRQSDGQAHQTGRQEFRRPTW